MTPDRIFYPLAALVAAGLIALAIAFPQGQGEQWPGVFGHPPEPQTEAAVAVLRHDAQIQAGVRKATEAMKTLDPAAGGGQAPAAPAK